MFPCAREQHAAAAAAVLDSVAARTLTLNPVSAREVICANARVRARAGRVYDYPSSTALQYNTSTRRIRHCVCVCVLHENRSLAEKKSGFFLVSPPVEQHVFLSMLVCVCSRNDRNVIITHCVCVCVCVSGAYWTFSRDGIIFIHLYDVIAIIPAGSKHQYYDIDIRIF